MSIINDALKKTQSSFKKLKKKEKEKVQIQEAQDSPKPKDDDVVNVYDKMYKAKEDLSKSSRTHVISEARPSKSNKAPRRADGWFKTTLAAVVLIGSLVFTFKFLGGYEPLQDFIRSKTGKTRSSRHLIAKHIPKKRIYKPGDLVLNGISFIDGTKVALINDEIYQVGDVVNNKEITSISDGTVELRNDEKIFTIKVR